MPGGPSGTGLLGPRRKPRPQRRTRHVNLGVASVVSAVRHVSPPPPARSTSRPPQQVVRQRATRKAAAPARRVLRRKHQRAVRQAPSAVRAARRVASSDRVLRELQRHRARKALAHRAREPLPRSYNARVAREVALQKLGSPYHGGLQAPPRQRVPDPSKVSHLIDIPKVARGISTRYKQAAKTQAGEGIPRGPGLVKAGPILLPAANVRSTFAAPIVQNAVKDAVQIPANAPAAIYNVGAAGFEALHGDTKRAKQIWEGLKEHDPIVLAAQGRFKEAAHEIGERPVSFGLEVSGVKASVGRTVGRAQRAAGVSREAQPAVLEGTRVRLRRPYSKDAETRRRQIRKDRKNERKAREFEEKAQQAFRDGAYEQAVEYRHKAREASPHHVTDKEVLRRVDERNDANEQVRRTFRGQAIQRAAKHQVPERKGGHLVPLVAQGIVHADKRDIALYLRELEHQFSAGRLTQAQRLANRKLAKQIRGALGSKQLDLPRVKRAAEGFAADQARAEEQLVATGLLDARQAEKARLIPYAVRRMGASHNGDRIVGPNGRFLSSADIKQHMLRSGVDPDRVAYLSQAPNARGARNFYMNTLQRQGVGSKVRTGEATRLGTFDSDPAILIEQASRVANLRAADHGFKGLVDEFAIRHPETGDVVTFSTKRSADLFIRDQHAHGARSLRAIRINPFAGKRSDLEALLEHVNEGTETPTGLLKAMQDAIDKDAEGAGPWAVIHETAARRIQEHLGLQNPMVGLKGLQKVNQAFRNAVLPTSVKWLTGNVVEASFRTALTRAGPLSYLTGRRTLGRLDDLARRGVIPESLAQEARARVTGGGHYSMAERTSVHRDASQFEHSALRPVARALGAVARAPVPRHVGLLWHAYTHFVFKANTLLETQFQTALAGKYVRDMLPTKGELSISRTAVEQAARGLTDTNEQVAMARFVDRAYGKYSKFNPTERALIAYYTPFIAWSLNAVKFVASVLPKDHPILTGLLVAAHNASDEWEKEHGLNLWIENAAPGWLQGSVPVSGGGKVRAGRYVPFGFFSDPAQSVASTVLPQYMGAIFALNGLDWKGDPLNGPGGGEPNPGQKFGTALGQFLGATVPVLGQVKSYQDKEGPTGQKLNRQLNPFYPVQPTERETGGTSDGPLDELQRLRERSGAQGALDELQKLRGG